ncbi:MAG TPA: hypothetical protein ENJ30_05785 [Desulfobulbaceae bacterium]|nr:hypothetical protein [Desulfobulbaceae bacterium]
MNSIQLKNMALFHSAMHTEIALRADLKPNRKDREKMKHHEIKFDHYLGIIKENGFFINENFGLPYRRLG